MITIYPNRLSTSSEARSDPGLVDIDIGLWPVSKDMLDEEEYRIADHESARYQYDYCMNQYDSNMNDLTNNWQEVAVALGKQIQIDLRNGYELEEIMPDMAHTVGADQAIYKRPSQIYDTIMGDKRWAVTGHFINMIQFLVSTSEHGPEIYAWYYENKGNNNGHGLQAPGFRIR